MSLTTSGATAALIHTQHTPDGWRIVLKNAAVGVVNLDLPSGPPASIRANEHEATRRLKRLSPSGVGVSHAYLDWKRRARGTWTIKYE